MIKKICIIPTDPIKVFYDKGEIKKNYYNPGNFFDEVHIISFCDKDIDEEKISMIAGSAKIKIHAVGPINIKSIFSMESRLTKLIEKIMPDVLRAYDPSIKGYWAVRLGKKCNIHTVVSLHNEYDEQRRYDNRIILLLRKLFENYVLKNADKIIGVTEYVSSYAKRRGAKDIDTIYNRVYNEEFNCQPYKRQPGLDKKRISILSVGRFVDQKNQICLIKAIKDLDVDLTFIGNGPRLGHAILLARKLRIEDRVKIIKAVPHKDINKYYCDSDIFAISTHYEGFCIPVLEAMASSLPIVASDIKPIREIVKDCGILVKNDPFEFKVALRSLITDPKKREELTKKAKERALTLDGKIMEEKEQQLYKQILDPTVKPRWSHKQHRDFLETGIGRHLHQCRIDYILNKVSQIKKELNRPLKILDLGCGDGVITKELYKISSIEDEIFGVDNDPMRIQMAKERYPGVDFRFGSAEKLDFKNESFDIVFLHHVIEHVENDKILLQECKRMLNANGYLILGFPNEGGTIGTILRKMHRGLYSKSEHVRFYSIESMRYFLEHNDFTIEEYNKFGILFPFYYVHLLLLMNRFTFKIGDKLAKRFDFLADSVIFVSKKRT